MVVGLAKVHPDPPENGPRGPYQRDAGREEVPQHRKWRNPGLEHWQRVRVLCTRKAPSCPAKVDSKSPCVAVGSKTPLVSATSCFMAVDVSWCGMSGALGGDKLDGRDGKTTEGNTLWKDGRIEMAGADGVKIELFEYEP